MKVTGRDRAFIKEVKDDVIIVQTTNDKTNFAVPRKYVGEGSGIINVPRMVITKGWCGTLVHYTGGVYGFMPDPGGEQI